MEKSILILNIFFMHALVFLNFLLKKWNPLFNIKTLQKKKKVDNYQKIKKMLCVSHEQIQFFKTREYVQLTKHFEKLTNQLLTQVKRKQK